MVESVAHTPAKFRAALDQITLAETTADAFWAEAAREQEFWDFAYRASVASLDAAIVKLAEIKARQPEGGA